MDDETVSEITTPEYDEDEALTESDDEEDQDPHETNSVAAASAVMGHRSKGYNWRERRCLLRAEIRASIDSKTGTQKKKNTYDDERKHWLEKLKEQEVKKNPAAALCFQTERHAKHLATQLSRIKHDAKVFIDILEEDYGGQRSKADEDVQGWYDRIHKKYLVQQKVNKQNKGNANVQRRRKSAYGLWVRLWTRSMANVVPIALPKKF